MNDPGYEYILQKFLRCCYLLFNTTLKGVTWERPFYTDVIQCLGERRVKFYYAVNEIFRNDA